MSFHPVHLILILAALLIAALMKAAHHGRRLKQLSNVRVQRRDERSTAERLAALEAEIARARSG